MQSEVHNETVCAARKDSDYSFTAVPSDARKGIISLLAVMVGFSFTSSSMVTGAKMGLNSDLLNFIYALLLGGIFFPSTPEFLHISVAEPDCHLIYCAAVPSADSAQCCRHCC